MRNKKFLAIALSVFASTTAAATPSIQQCASNLVKDQVGAGALMVNYSDYAAEGDSWYAAFGVDNAGGASMTSSCVRSDGNYAMCHYATIGKLSACKEIAQGIFKITIPDSGGISPNQASFTIDTTRGVTTAGSISDAGNAHFGGPFELCMRQSTGHRHIDNGTTLYCKTYA